MWAVSVASEWKMRRCYQGIVGDNLEAEFVPMSFSLKDGSEEIRLTPYSYIPNLGKRWNNFSMMMRGMAKQYI